MRTLKQFMLLLVTLSIVSLNSCSTDDDGGSNGSAPSGVLSAKVDGVDYQSMEISSSATVANGGQNLIIIASNSDGKAFAITVLGFDGVGTYQLGGGANILNSASYTKTDVDLSNPQNSTTEIWQAPYDNTIAGEIKISEVTDGKVIGTFEFTCKNVGGDQSLKTITAGSFNLNKQII